MIFNVFDSFDNRHMEHEKGIFLVICMVDLVYLYECSTSRKYILM